MQIPLVLLVIIRRKNKLKWFVNLYFKFSDQSPRKKLTNVLSLLNVSPFNYLKVKLMSKFVQFLVCLLVLFSVSAQAEWQPVHQAKQPGINPTAQGIADQINALPDPLFMSNSEQAKVDELLSATLYQIDEGTKGFEQALADFRHHTGPSNWFNVQEYYLTLHSYSQSKQDLLKMVPSRTKHKLTGFGPYGVTQFQAEWQLTRLNAQYLLFYQIESFRDFIDDLTISPVPFIAMLVKLMFVYLLLSWWLRNSKEIIRHFRITKLETTNSPSLLVRFIWYISKAHRPIAWLIAITVSLEILSTLQSLEHIKFLDIFTWWILGGSIAVKFILEFAYRNSRSTAKDLMKVRLTTIRYYVWSIIGAGLFYKSPKRLLVKVQFIIGFRAL